jgi:hypothetical protein
MLLEVEKRLASVTCALGKQAELQGRIREDNCSLLVNVLVEGVVDFLPF